MQVDDMGWFTVISHSLLHIESHLRGIKYKSIQISTNASWRHGLVYSNIPFFVAYWKSPQGDNTVMHQPEPTPHNYAVPVAGQEGVQVEIM